MPTAETFDITTGIDLQEVDNALNQARKEMEQRYDFKGVPAEIEYDRKAAKLVLTTADDFKLKAMWQILEEKMIKRGVPVKNLKQGKVEKALGDSVVEKISTTLNMPPDQIFGFLAKWLPTIIDTLSPNGTLQAPPAK